MKKIIALLAFIALTSCSGSGTPEVATTTDTTKAVVTTDSTAKADTASAKVDTTKAVK